MWGRPALQDAPTPINRLVTGLLPTHSGGSKALDDLALEQDKDDYQRQGTNYSTCHPLCILDAIGILDRSQAHWNGHQLWRVGNDKWPQKVVPAANKDEDRNSHDY